MTYSEDLDLKFIFKKEEEKDLTEYLRYVADFLKLSEINISEVNSVSNLINVLEGESIFLTKQAFGTESRRCGIILSCFEKYPHHITFTISFSCWKYSKELHINPIYLELKSLILNSLDKSYPFALDVGCLNLEDDTPISLSDSSPKYLKLRKNTHFDTGYLAFNDLNYFSNELLAKHDNKAFFESFEQLVRIPFAEGWLSIDKKGIFAEVLPEIQELATKLSSQKEDGGKKR